MLSMSASWRLPKIRRDRQRIKKDLDTAVSSNSLTRPSGNNKLRFPGDEDLNCAVPSNLISPPYSSISSDGASSRSTSKAGLNKDSCVLGSNAKFLPAVSHVDLVVVAASCSAPGGVGSGEESGVDNVGKKLVDSSFVKKKKKEENGSARKLNKTKTKDKSVRNVDDCLEEKDENEIDGDVDVCNDVSFSDYYNTKNDGWWSGDESRYTGTTGGLTAKAIREVGRVNKDKNNNDSFDYNIDQQGNSDTEGMPAITRFVLMGSKMETPAELSRVDPATIKRTMEGLDYEPNPDVAPYQPANFMSSTILKKVPIPKRHLDTFGGYEYNFMGKRGVMLHTDRYQVDFIKSFDGMTQRERLQAGLNYVEAMRGTKRRRELVPHRAQLDLILGGKQIEFEERFYLSRELQKLKALAMPDIAKDLYHGRGIHLPIDHNSLKPRYPLPNDIEDECMASAPSTLQTVLRKNDNQHDFPRIDRDPSFMGRGSQLRTKSTLNRHPQLPSIRGRMDTGFDVIRTGRLPPRGSKSWPFPVSKSSERRTVTTLSARLGLGYRLNHDVTSLTRSHTQAPPPSRDEGHGHPQPLLTKGRSGITTQRKVSPAVDVPVVGNQKLKESDTEKPPQPWMPSQEPETIAGDSAAPSAQPDAAPGEAHAPVTVSGGTNEAPPSSQSKVRPGTEEGAHRTTPNPLRGGDLIHSVPQDEQEELRQTFQRLDTDMDGHIKYNQLKTQLPQAFSWEQERFIEEVYNLTNSITFFGVDEFMAMDRLSKTVEALTGKAKDAYASLDFASISDELLKYVGKFDVADSGNHSTISIDSLQRILSETVSPTLTSDRAIWDEVMDTISTDYGAKISKINFIAHIPLFLSLHKDFK